MNQTIKTLVFLGVAVVSVGIGFATHVRHKPVDLAAFSDVGKQFFPDFTDPNVATGLRVVAFNDDTGRTEVFSVEFKNGLWRIPSHHDYPADGQERLAKTAASMIGVERQALIERTKAAHRRHRLIDPLDTEETGTIGRGDRITLYKGDDVLVDLIVGNQVENQQNLYYVRAAGEDRFYTADLGELEISTKFSDWIERGILGVRRNDIRELVINRYRIDESRGVLIQGDRMNLSREASTSPWELKGLDVEKESLQNTEINNMLAALEDLSIVGVRKKPAGISADLKAEDGISMTALDMLDLQEKGFFIDQRQGRILSNEGEVLVGTEAGVLYVLRFGEEFSGTDVEIEVGSASKGEESVEKSDNEAEAESEGAEKAPSDLRRSRYLFVTAQFDGSLLGEQPTPPVKPEPPAKGDEQPSPEPASETPPADPPQDSTKSNVDAADDEKPDPQKMYEEALQRYEEELEAYEFKLKDYEKRVQQAEEQVVELNRRFADWYYVISADVFNRMAMNRSDLVETKEVEATPEKPATPSPEATTPDAPATPAKPEENGVPSDKPTDKPAEVKPAEESTATPEAKPASENPELSTQPTPEKSDAAPPETPEPESKTPTPDEPAPPATPSVQD